MAISVGLYKKARSIEGVEGWPFRAVAEAMEVIPRTLVQNCGGNAIRVLTELRVSSTSFLESNFAHLSRLCRLNMRVENMHSVSMARLERSST